MPTQHQIRFLALVPAARKNVVNTWIRNNLDVTGGDWLTAGLNTTGTGAPTYYWFSAALTVPEFKKLTNQLLGSASISLPANWDTLTNAQKFQWIGTQKSAVTAVTGIRMRVFANDADWDNPADELAAAGLLPIVSKLP